MSRWGDETRTMPMHNQQGAHVLIKFFSHNCDPKKQGGYFNIRTYLITMGKALNL